MRALCCALLLAAAAAAAGKTEAAIRAAYGEAALTVTSRGGTGSGVVSRASSAFPRAVADAVSAKAGQHLTVTFGVTDAATGEAFLPHQAFVRLTNKASGAATFFVAASDSGAGLHRWSVDVGDRAALAGAADGGAFTVDLVIGDARLSNPAVWTIGTVQLTTPAAPAKAAPPLYTTPLLHESDIALSPLREIQHVFRPDEVRPPVAFSLAAAGTVLGLLAVWILVVAYVTGLPGSLRLPPGALGWAYALLFHGSLAATLLLYAAYWWGLPFVSNFFALLGWLPAPLIVLALSGQRLLTVLHDAAADKAKAE